MGRPGRRLHRDLRPGRTTQLAAALGVALVILLPGAAIAVAGTTSTSTVEPLLLGHRLAGRAGSRSARSAPQRRSSRRPDRAGRCGHVHGGVTVAHLRHVERADRLHGRARRHRHGHRAGQRLHGLDQELDHDQRLQRHEHDRPRDRGLDSSSHITLSNNHVSFSGQPVSGQTASGIYLSNTAPTRWSSATPSTTTPTPASSSPAARRGNEVSGNVTFANAAGLPAGGDRASASTRRPGNIVDRQHHPRQRGLRDRVLHRLEQHAALRQRHLRQRRPRHRQLQVDRPARSSRTRSTTTSTAGINVEGNSTGATLANNISVDNGINSPRTHSNIRIELGLDERHDDRLRPRPPVELRHAADLELGQLHVAGGVPVGERPGAARDRRPTRSGRAPPSRRLPPHWPARRRSTRPTRARAASRPSTSTARPARRPGDAEHGRRARAHTTTAAPTSSGERTARPHRHQPADRLDRGGRLPDLQRPGVRRDRQLARRRHRLDHVQHRAERLVRREHLHGDRRRSAHGDGQRRRQDGHRLARGDGGRARPPRPARRRRPRSRRAGRSRTRQRAATGTTTRSATSPPRPRSPSRPTGRAAAAPAPPRSRAHTPSRARAPARRARRR